MKIQKKIMVILGELFLGNVFRMMLTEHNFRRFARPLWKLRLELGLVVLQNSLQLQFFWGTAYLQIVFWPQFIHYKRLLVFAVGPFKDSYNLNTFGGPGRNAYKGIALLQKPGTQQSDPYKMEPYRTLCRGHMIPAFVETMVSPIFYWTIHFLKRCMDVLDMHFFQTKQMHESTIHHFGSKKIICNAIIITSKDVPLKKMFQKSRTKNETMFSLENELCNPC